MDKTHPQHRYRYVELVAWWEGQINTRQIVEQFGLSRQQASSDINAYNELTKGNLAYDASRKAWIPSSHFRRHYISDDVTEYLNWIQTGYRIPAPAILPHESLRLPARHVAPTVMRGLIAGIRQQQRVEVDYVSLSNPNREGRVIAPHTFVNTGLRWHLRAFCEKSGEYRDFVLSRFRGEPELIGRSRQTADQDEAWNTEVTLIFAPDPRLPDAKREVLEHDYQMTDGHLYRRTRACLVQYLIQEMQVNTKIWDGTPEAQQLVLVNRDDVKEWLFEG
ncbi:WYL domain-containing protein [Marinimicrobium sp. C6131]|uniref:WYL domain-containing protein n=1 Tax=Marinimicrobium sp. C6131 TaxID=3022676 RepID=UPI00223C98C7|nr:WYL domain-containing protein [Marinimicrobium sp. C6131]UZJ45774.1 WYL domain-containing protein [Marinimicrobium sp. C6131]